jgi:hypothetical protein
MFTGITSRALVTAIVVLTAGAILRGGAAAADSNQDEQFLALLDEEDIPALEGVPSLIATAHNVCRKLDGGMTVEALVDDMRNNSFTDPTGQRFPDRRITATITRFISAAVEAYCPYDQSKIASNPAPGSNEPTHRVAAYTHNAVTSGSDLREPPLALDMINMPATRQEPTGTAAVRLPQSMGGGVFVPGRYRGNRSDCDAHGTLLASLIGAVSSRELTPPNPPQIPTPPPPPTAQMLTPPRPIVAPLPPKQPPPLPKQPPPPSQQVEPPAVGPQPGGAAGGGGSGGTGGDGPAEPSPTPPMPPGLVGLAP